MYEVSVAAGVRSVMPPAGKRASYVEAEVLVAFFVVDPPDVAVTLPDPLPLAVLMTLPEYTVLLPEAVSCAALVVAAGVAVLELLAEFCRTTRLFMGHGQAVITVAKNRRIVAIRGVGRVGNMIEEV